MSETIRAYARQHAVFGTDEIRQLHGEKAALLCTRLAKKGDFQRIRNGVYALDGHDDKSPAYAAYLARMEAARELNAKNAPEPKLIDQLIDFAKTNGDFSTPEVNAFFGKEMKGYISSYVKRGVFVRVSPGRYSFATLITAPRREARPSAEPTTEEHEVILDLLQTGTQTIASITQNTGIASIRLKDILETMVRRGETIRREPISKAAKSSYELPNGPDTQEIDVDALAIIAASGGLSTRALATHKIQNTPDVIRCLEYKGLIARNGHDEALGGTIFIVTAEGVLLLQELGREWQDTVPITQRPKARAILREIRKHPSICYDALIEKTSLSRGSVEYIVHQLAKAAVVRIEPTRPVTVRML